MDVSVEVHCGRCGSANYSFPRGGEAEAEIRCNDCGERMGSLGELAELLMEQVDAHSAQAQRDQIDRSEVANQSGRSGLTD